MKFFLVSVTIYFLLLIPNISSFQTLRTLPIKISRFSRLNDVVSTSSPLIEEGTNTISSAISVSLNDVQNILIVLSGVAYFIYENRPRGSSRDDLLEVRKSIKIPNNLGVFAKKFIPAGTVLGEYPGYVKSIESFKQSKIDEKALALAKKYTWKITDEKLLDPTDQSGLLGLEITYLFGLVKSSTTLARLNEPPYGNDVNAYTRVSDVAVEVITEKDIFSDEEIFIDYGFDFDRSDYPTQASILPKDDDAILTPAQKEKMMKLQPVTTDSALTSSSSSESSPLFDQDTSLSDGFLSKLAKQQDRYKQSGILSPEEGVRLFSEVGETLFGSAEDLELLESITGKKSAKIPVAPASSPPPSPRKSGAAESTSLLDSSVEEDFLRSMIGKTKPSGKSEIATPLETASQRESGPDVDSPKQPPLSMEEAAELQSRLDNMTDEQVEKVFEKLRVSLGDKLKGELKASMQAKKAKGMPKAPAVNPSVRSEFAEELKQVEDELEKMYNDPVSVWQDMLRRAEADLLEGSQEADKSSSS